jgi:hypothetical protein
MMLQLNPTFPVEVDDKGKGVAVLVDNPGDEHHLYWVVVLDATGEIWYAANPTVRFRANWSFGRSLANA